MADDDRNCYQTVMDPPTHLVMPAATVVSLDPFEPFSNLFAQTKVFRLNLGLWLDDAFSKYVWHTEIDTLREGEPSGWA